jgi:SAM-dependent methyltransferase
MNETAKALTKPELGSVTKDRSLFARILANCIRRCHIDTAGKALIVGGSIQDVGILQSAGFRSMTLSTFQPVSREMHPEAYGLGVEVVFADAERMELPDESYDFVIAHEVLHHCRSPHVALGEMLRVSRHHVIILEPNDSWLMSALVKAGFSFPYELPAVIYHNYESGGVRDSCVPNFIYRWNKNDVFKAVSSFIPEREFDLYVYPYWDFNVDSQELALRTHTRISTFTDLLGPDNFLGFVRVLQKVLNRVPLAREQGNKFFCCIGKKDHLKPWLTRERNRIIFNREFGRTA